MSYDDRIVSSTIPWESADRRSIICMAKQRAYFLSDLHLFARRSSAETVQHSIDALANCAHTLVLGGDIFDFRWSRWSDQARTVRESVLWLERLITLNSDCQVHFLLGNHDANQAFIEQLTELSQAYSNLQWHPHLLRLEDCVFLHGDIIDAGIPLCDDFHVQLDALRRRKEDRTSPAPIQHALYDAAVSVRVHRLVSQVVNPQSKVLNRVTRYLEWAGYGPEAGIQNVFFGHTHRRLDQVLHAGMRFHNPGATIKGLDFQMLEVPLERPRERTVPALSTPWDPRPE